MSDKKKKELPTKGGKYKDKGLIRNTYTPEGGQYINPEMQKKLPKPVGRKTEFMEDGYHTKPDGKKGNTKHSQFLKHTTKGKQ